MSELMRRLNPAVPRRVLPRIAGVIWGMVGIMLLTRAGVWFSAMPVRTAAPAAVVGVVMAVVLIPTSFRRLVRRNLARIAGRPDRACFFSVFPWRSWVMVLVMSVVGVSLRHSALPRPWLAAPYLGMGLCLLTGGWQYLSARVE